MSLIIELPVKIRRRVKSGKITEQKLWRFIQELNSHSEERLGRTAVISGGKRISYSALFEEWDRYARVFSALGITEENHSRAGLLSGRDRKSVDSLYGLNITGTSVSLLHELDILDHKRWDQLILKEGITDLILTDRKLTRSRLLFIRENKDRLGIRNVIILNSSGEEDDHYLRLKRVEGVLFMEDLLEEHADHDIVYGSDGSKEDAVIFHTSGTTSGIHKPVPISDAGFNESAARFLRDDRFTGLEIVVSILSVELTSAYGSCDMLHLPFAYGGSVVLMPQGATEKQMLRAIEKHKVNILFAVRDLFELLEDVKPAPDLSSLEMVFIGGSYVSPDAKRRYCEFLKKCGSAGRVFIGYGMTETGGAAVLADSECFEDSIGRPLSGIKVRILDEEDGNYYDPSDGERTGVLCISSPSVSGGRLNGQTFFELIDIDGEKYLNTYDLVEVMADQSLKIVGRMNKFFVNNEGIRFDAGLIETAVSARPGITACGLVPEYNKQLHDTVPVLYIQLADPEKSSKVLIRDALYRIFVKEGRIRETNLPASVVICRELPVNQMGKVDVQDIVKRGAKGKRYVVMPVRKHEELTDVRIVPWKDAGLYMNGGIPEELEYEMELYGKLLKGRRDDPGREKRGMPVSELLIRILIGFLEEMEEAEERRRSRRGRRSPYFFRDLEDLYSGFGDRYDEDGE
ncbi:MAG: class I adenylate-forming enzyme family protein [Eubacteriales bacterium]|nr:class I adenylate-forming enzyme family protein [Eubacteriales bacterium]